MAAMDLKAFGDMDAEQLLFMARLSETAERYEDMAKIMHQLVTLNCPASDLTVEERNLLSVAYKNVVGARRASWRTLNAEDNGDSAPVAIFRKQVETELTAVCGEVLALIKDQLVPAAEAVGNVEAQVFYLKMAGDYYRYSAEFAPIQENSDLALKNYDAALTLATTGLAPTHPIRLGLALNFSVCYYEILGDHEKACALAKSSFDEAATKLETLQDNDYKDSTLIMQLLRDNLSLWTQANDEEEEE